MPFSINIVASKFHYDEFTRDVLYLIIMSFYGIISLIPRPKNINFLIRICHIYEIQETIHHSIIHSFYKDG